MSDYSTRAGARRARAHTGGNAVPPRERSDARRRSPPPGHRPARRGVVIEPREESATVREDRDVPITISSTRCARAKRASSAAGSPRRTVARRRAPRFDERARFPQRSATALDPRFPHVVSRHEPRHVTVQLRLHVGAARISVSGRARPEARAGRPRGRWKTHRPGTRTLYMSYSSSRRSASPHRRGGGSADNRFPARRRSRRRRPASSIVRWSARYSCTIGSPVIILAAVHASTPAPK